MRAKFLILILFLFVCFTIKAQLNLGFESLAPGTYNALTGWATMKGNVAMTNSSGICQTLTPVASAPVFKIVSTPYTIPLLTNFYNDFALPTVPGSPLPGSKALELNGSDNIQNYNLIGSIRADQTFTVTPSTQLLQYAYYSALPNSPHTCCQSHYGLIQLLDCSGNLLSGTDTYLVPWGTTTMNTCYNSGTVGLSLSTNTAVAPLNALYTPVWLIKTFNLAAYTGSCVTLRAETGCCSALGHGGLYFFDSEGYSSPFFVNNNAVNGSTYNLCNATTATLSAIPANSYTWNGPGNFSSNASSFTTTAAGIYTLTLGNHGSPALTQTFNLVIATTPTLIASANVSTLCVGQSAVLTATGNGISTYSWSTGGTTPVVTVTPSISTVYTITANSATCPATATVALNVNTCSGISEFFSARNFLNVYPNPNKGTFTIESKTTQNIKLLDVTGRIIKEEKLEESNDHKLIIDHLPKGVYFAEGNFTTFKIVVLD